MDIAPRADEDIFLKRFMDTFTDIKDVRASPELAAYVATQRSDNILKDGSIAGAAFGRTTFADHLNRLGAKCVTIMGTMAEFCITDNALGAAMNGLRPVILSDRIVGWNDKTYTKPVWHESSPRQHADSIKNTLQEIKRDPMARGFRASDAKAVENAVNKIEIRTSGEFLSSLPAPEKNRAAARPRRDKGAKP